MGTSIVCFEDSDSGITSKLRIGVSCLHLTDQPGFETYPDYGILVDVPVRLANAE